MQLMEPWHFDVGWWDPGITHKTMTRSQLSPSLHTQELKEFPQKHFSDFFWMACIQPADGVLTVGDSLFVWSHSFKRILESSSNCLTWYLPSWHVSKDRVKPPHLWTFWMVFFLQSVQELLSDAIVQPAGPTSGSRKTTQDQDPIYPNVIIWPYCELQAILEHDIRIITREFKCTNHVFLCFLSHNYMPMSCKHDKRSMIFPNCTCKHIQNSTFSVSNLLHSGSTSWVLPAIDDHDVAKQVLSVALLPATLQWSNLAQMKAWKGQSPNTWQTPGCFFAVVIYGKWTKSMALNTCCCISLLYTSGFTLRYLY